MAAKKTTKKAPTPAAPKSRIDAMRAQREALAEEREKQRSKGKKK